MGGRRSSAPRSASPASYSLHGHREWAESFGGDAGLYHRARPRYPIALVDHLLREEVRSVVDVGCGTGIAAALFSDTAREVLGVDPDPRMAEIARRGGLEVEVATFESWHCGDRRFDLLVSGQAWHWIDPEAGPTKAAAVLREGGRVAIFWNACQPPAALYDEILAIYADVAPEFERYSVLLDHGAERVPGVMQGLSQHGPFLEPQHRVWRWGRHYTTDEWLEHLITHSDHQALPVDRRQRLFAKVSRAFERLGGSAEMPYETHLVIARSATR